MPLSLKSKISKLRYKGQITDTEYQELIQKLEGHDRQIRADAIDEVMEMLKNEWTLDSILCATDKYRLIAIFKRIAEQLKEQNK